MFVYFTKQHPLKVRAFPGSWQLLVISDAFLNRQCVYETEVQGLEYAGFLARTQDDEPCVRWDSVVESEGTADFVFPDGSRTLAADYCRNPGGRERVGPWCYTDTAGTWNNCSVPICGEYDSYNISIAQCMQCHDLNGTSQPHDTNLVLIGAATVDYFR